MGQHYPMRRFPEKVDGLDGVFSPAAKDYGIGAFNWKTDFRGVRWILFRHPDKLFTHTDGEPVSVGAVPVNNDQAVAGEARWTWDDNEEAPTLTPSISFKTKLPEHTPGAAPDAEGWTETFHGFITAGELDVL